MTKIEWVRADDGSEGLSWNALRAVRIDETGKRRSANHCEHVNEACRFCYADKGNARLGGLPFKPGHRKDYTFEVDEKKLLEPLRRKKPTRIFVESMSDAFGEWWPDEFIDKLYAVMALCPQHTFINLTKRPERRREYLRADRRSRWHNAVVDVLRAAKRASARAVLQHPLPNVIEGVSVSCQEEADAFVPILLDTPAACRVVSAEPLLGPIDFTNVPTFARMHEGIGMKIDALTGMYKNGRLNLIATAPKLDWIITGGESGPKARPMHPDWARDIRDQCKAASVAFFFKQWGENLPIMSLPSGQEAGCDGFSRMSGHLFNRVGKKAAGRLLDGKEHNEFPSVTTGGE